MKATDKFNVQSIYVPKIKVKAVSHELLIFIVFGFMVLSLISLSYVRYLNSHLSLEISNAESQYKAQMILYQRLNADLHQLSDHKRVYDHAIMNKMSLPELDDDIIV